MPIVPPVAPGAISPDTSTLLLVGGVTVVGVVLVSVLTR